MPALNPTGFTLLGDATVSSPMDVNTFVGEINPAYSYFAGDIAAFSIFTPGTSSQTLLPGGYIYPYPISYVQTEGETQPLDLNFSKAGVFQYFNYTPASTKIPVQSRVFIANTQVVPGTKITATISFSPTATFQAQIKTDTLQPTGIPRNWLYTFLGVGSDQPTQDITITFGAPSYTYVISFPTGNTDPFQGGSLSYLKSMPGEGDSNDQYVYTTPASFNSILFLKMTDIGGSGFSTQNNVISNPIVQCALTNNSILQPIGSYNGGGGV